MLKKLARLGALAEDTALVLLLGAMVVLASSQIILRNGFGEGFVWADESLRLMVLWLALVGSIAASRADKHISINVLARFLPPTGQVIARIVTNAFTAVVCMLVGYFALQFVMQSREFEDELLGGLPAWWFQWIMPVAFFLMGWRYFCFFVVDVWSLLSRQSTDEESEAKA